jgi:hypothetical protein
MARNLAQRLDRIERLAAELLNREQGPIYVTSLENLSEADEARAVVVRRVYVEPPKRDDTLPAVPAEPSADLFGADDRKPPNAPDLGVIQFQIVDNLKPSLEAFQ